MLITDCDGCLTDGGMYYSENGDELKKFNTKDGMAFQLLKENGIITELITGESVELNRRRAEKLHLDVYEQGCKNKFEKIVSICENYHVKPENVCYIGDDINDLDVIRYVGLGCCPADAVDSVIESADYVSDKKGGSGIIRDAVDFILKQNRR